MLYNIWDNIVIGIVYFVQTIIVPLLVQGFWFVGGGGDVDMQIYTYVRIFFDMFYPIATFFDLRIPAAFVVSVIVITTVDTLISAWEFIKRELPKLIRNITG